MPAMLAAIFLTCTAIDGDTLLCRDAKGRTEHVRLLGIDAPELPGHCRTGRACAPGDPVASKAALQAAVTGHRVRIERYKLDLYGRTLAFVSWRGQDLSCQQLASGNAIYRPEWDRGERIGRCPR